MIGGIIQLLQYYIYIYISNYSFLPMCAAGREVQTNTSAGVIISGQSLVLQKVDRYSRGRYTCHATNAQGPGESNAVMLKVRREY